MQLGVRVSDVSITIQTPSPSTDVVLQLVITYQDEDAASAGLAALSVQLNSTTSAAELLSTPENPITVRSVSTPPEVEHDLPENDLYYHITIHHRTPYIMTFGGGHDFFPGEIA